MVKICPMAQTQGCLMDKCIFFDSEQLICYFLRQYLLVFETHTSSHLSLLLTHGYREVSDILSEKDGLDLLSRPAKMIAVYLEYLRNLMTSEDVPKKSKKQIEKILLELETVFDDHRR